MYQCSKCGTVLNPDGMCSACGLAHNIPAPTAAAPQMQAPQMQQMQAPQAPKPPSVQKGDFCAKCGTALPQWKTCPNGCVTGGGGGVNLGGVDGLIDLSSGEPHLTLGANKFKLGIVLAVLSGLMAIMFILPWYSTKMETVSISTWSGPTVDTVSMTGGGFEIVSGVYGDAETRLGWQMLKALGMGIQSGGHIFLFILPLLFGCAAFLFTKGILKKSMLANLQDKYHLLLTCGFGLIFLLQIIFWLSYSSTVRAPTLLGLGSSSTLNVSVVPHVGWIFYMIFNLAAAGLCVLCYLKEKKQ
jgi:hypothetical protein